MPLGTCILWEPEWECLSPEEGPINWRTPEEREEMRAAFRRKLAQ